jgi:hypothetical protein
MTTTTTPPRVSEQADEVLISPMFLASAAFCIENYNTVAPKTRQAMIDKLLDVSDRLQAAKSAALTQKAAPEAPATTASVPHTYAAFRSRYYVEHKKMPSDQEVFDAGMRSGRDLQWRDKATTASVNGEALTDAEFLSKRLSRVARLAGVAMPSGTYEQIAEVAGTILGDIARALEASRAPTPRREAALLNERAEFSLFSAWTKKYTKDNPGVTLSPRVAWMGRAAIARQAAPEAPTALQELRDGYQGSTMASDLHGPKITMRYATSAQADAAHDVLCRMIDETPTRASPAATTTSAPRMVRCEECNEGKRLRHAAGPNGPIEYIEDCSHCDGTGEVEADDEATTASQSDADKMLAMRAEYDRKDGAARGTLMGGATTANTGPKVRAVMRVNAPLVQAHRQLAVTTASASFHELKQRIAETIGEGNSVTIHGRALAPSREAAPQIKTWQERAGENWPHAPLQVCQDAMIAEIADLRAALAQQGATPSGTVQVPINAYLWLMGMGQDGFAQDRSGEFWWRGAFNERAGLDMMAVHEASKGVARHQPAGGGE